MDSRTASLACALIVAVFSLGCTAAHAGCGGTPATYCSKSFMAVGDCPAPSTDVVAILKEPWEKQPIEILAVTVGLRILGPSVRPYVFAGNSEDPDVMLLQIGTGSTTKQFAPGHGFILSGSHPDAPHVDLHVGCSNGPAPPSLWSRLKFHLFGAPPPLAPAVPTSYEGWLVIDYELR